jgi:hypothetical protein
MLVSKNETADELLILLSMAKLQNSQLESIKNISQNVDWKIVFQLAKVNQTIPLVWHNLKVSQLDYLVPPDLAEKFLIESEKIKAINALRIKTGLLLLKELSNHGVKVAILKGIYFAESLYHNPYYKKMNDIDVLIEKNDVHLVLETLKKLKYFSAGELLGKSAENQVDISHHLPPFFSRDLNVMIGFRWEFVSPSNNIKLNYQDIWSRAKNFNFYGANCYHLTPEDNLLHLCIHLSLYKSGVKEVADIYNLILNNNINWTHFESQLKDKECFQRVLSALTISQKMMPINDVEQFIEYLKAKHEIKIDEDTLKKCRSRSYLLRTRTTYTTLLDKEFIQFKSSESFKEKFKSMLKIWQLLLFPTKQESVKLTFADSYNPLLKLFAPYKIAKHLCNELGTFIFILLNFYLIYSTTKAAFRALIGIRVKKFSDYANDLGLDSDSINELRARLE